MSKMTWRVTVLGLLSLVNERPKQNFNRFHKPKIWIWKSHGIFVNLENETRVLPTTIVACSLARSLAYDLQTRWKNLIFSKLTRGLSF